MSAIILDGKKLAEKVQYSIKTEVDSLQKKIGRVPGLGVILVGDNPASKVYVANKEKFAHACGFKTFDKKLSESISESELKNAINEFNQNSEIDGILLQLPLPKHLNQNIFIDLIEAAKDADGLHPYSQGLMLRGASKSEEAVFIRKSCTPLGSMRLIDFAFLSEQERDQAGFFDIPEADLSGKSAVVIGRSILVGKPVAMMLLDRNATVTMAHSRTKDLDKVCAQADIVVAAVGKAKLVKSSWIKEGAIVIDVGINRLDSGALCGDVDFEDVKGKAYAITPVPKGVGPMTIAMLMLNTFGAYKENFAKKL